jgi:hypothetical protein
MPGKRNKGTARFVNEWFICNNVVASHLNEWFICNNVVASHLNEWFICNNVVAKHALHNSVAVVADEPFCVNHLGALHCVAFCTLSSTYVRVRLLILNPNALHQLELKS